LAEISHEALADLIGTIYEAAYDPGHWPGVVDNLRILFDGSKACFARVGPEMRLWDAVATDFDLDMQLTLISSDINQNEYSDAVTREPVGTIFSDMQLIGEQTLRRSRFWNEWMVPQDMYGGLTTKLMIAEESYWFFDVQRGRNQPRLDKRERELLALLAPHLRRAAQMGRTLHQALILRSAFAALPLGVVQIDTEQRLVTVNDAAESILDRRGSPLMRKSGRLAASDPKHRQVMENFLAEACRLPDAGTPSSHSELRLPSGANGSAGIDLILSSGPVPGHDSMGAPFLPGAVIFIRDVALTLRGGSLDQFAKVFAFTPAEARLAAALASGMSLREAAADLGLKYGTVRSYLERIFRKTETRQQSQLVALLRSAQPLFPPTH
jgi:DNA-binding CsgD family transcriptional regulator